MKMFYSIKIFFVAFLSIIMAGTLYSCSDAADEVINEETPTTPEHPCPPRYVIPKNCVYFEASNVGGKIYTNDIWLDIRYICDKPILPELDTYFCEQCNVSAISEWEQYADCLIKVKPETGYAQGDMPITVYPGGDEYTYKWLTIGSDKDGIYFILEPNETGIGRSLYLAMNWNRSPKLDYSLVKVVRQRPCL